LATKAFSITKAVAAADADVAAGPGRSICERRGGLRIGTEGIIRRGGRSGKCRRGGQKRESTFMC